MKKLLSLILIIVVVAVFSACADEEKTFEISDDIMYSDSEEYFYDYANPENPVNVVKNVNELANLFMIESPETLGENYGYFFHMAKNDNYVVRPLIGGEDVSQLEGYGEITLVPPEKEGDYSHIVYGYTNGTYNYSIKVYYLYDHEYNVAMVGGIHALNNGDEAIVERENYNGFTIVNYLPTETSYAEYVLRERYFIVITGAKITNEKFPDVIEKEALDLLSFDEIQIAEG